jgi:hypothetical protein
MGRRRAALVAGTALLQLLGTLAPVLLSQGRPSGAPIVATAHVERPAAAVTGADRHERHAGAPCHEAAPGPERSDLDPVLGARCPCGCGGLPGSVTSQHAGSGPALLAHAPALGARSARTPLAPPAERLPESPASCVDHVPIAA